MRIVFALFVFTCCLAYSSSTIKLFKPKIKSEPLIYSAVAGYNPVTYLSAPVVIPGALPATYARPLSTYSTYVATYALASSVPQPYETTFAAPVVYAQPATVSAHLVQYHEPKTVYVEPFSSYASNLEGELYDQHFAKHYE